MIEIEDGLANLEEICSVEGVDGIYVGPGDLMLALGGKTVNDRDYKDAFETALTRIALTAAKAGIAAGIHTPAGDIAAKRLTEGYTFATISSDLNHLDKVAADHLKSARG